MVCMNIFEQDTEDIVLQGSAGSMPTDSFVRLFLRPSLIAGSTGELTERRLALRCVKEEFLREGFTPGEAESWKRAIARWPLSLPEYGLYLQAVHELVAEWGVR